MHPELLKNDMKHAEIYNPILLMEQIQLIGFLPEAKEEQIMRLLK